MKKPARVRNLLQIPWTYSSNILFILFNRCGRDTTMIYSYNSNRPYQEFRIKVFRFFNGYSSIYLHCELLACHRSSINSRLVSLRLHFVSKLRAVHDVKQPRSLVTLSIQLKHLYHRIWLALTNKETTSPSFLRADNQRGAAELTIARRKRRLVVLLF